MPFYANTTYQEAFDPRETKYNVPELENLPHKYNFIYTYFFFIEDLYHNIYLFNNLQKNNKNLLHISLKKSILFINNLKLIRKKLKKNKPFNFKFNYFSIV